MLVLSVLTFGTRPPRPVGAVSWGSTTAIPGADPYDNSFPKIVQSSNGSLWLVWAKLIGTYHEVYLMVNNGVGWSGQIPIVNSNGASDDIDPTIAQMSNGTIILVWSKGASGAAGCFGTTAYDLFTQSYTNNKWSNPIRLVQAAGDDISPALTRLRDGRLFLTWSKRTKTNGYGDKNSTNNGSTWSPDQADATLINSDEKEPYLIQNTDKKLYLVYSSNQRLGNPYGTLNLYMTTSGIVKAHDLAVTSVTPSSKVPRV